MTAPDDAARAAYQLGAALVRAERFEEALPILRRARALWEERGGSLAAARCNWQRGVALRFLGRVGEAAELLGEAASVLRRAGQELEAARVERDLAIACNLLERFDEAQALVASARAAFERCSHPVEVARCDLVTGSRLRQLSRYGEAVRVLGQALGAFRAADRPVEEGKALFLMGLSHLGRQAYDDALATLGKAQALFASADLPMRVGFCDLALGRALWRVGRLGDAEAHMAQARRFFIRHGMRRAAADCSLNRGNVAFVQGDDVRARELYEEARRIYQELGVGSFVARCDQNLGLVYRREGRFTAALDQLHRAARRLEELGVHAWAADCHEALADIHVDLHQFDMAASHVERARRTYAREGMRLGEALCDLRRARIARQEDDEAAMEEALEDAHRAVEATGSDRYRALWQRAAADLLLEEGKVAQAEGLYEGARAHFAAAGAAADEAAAMVGLGRIARRCGELDRATALLEAALRATGEALPGLNWRAYGELGCVAAARGDQPTATAWYEEAVTALRRARQTVPEAGMAGGFAASRRAVYDGAVQLALERGDGVRALEIVEESRAQVLARALDGGPRVESEDVGVGRLEREERELRRAVERARRRALGSLEAATASPGQAAGERPEGPAPDAAAVLARLRMLRSEHRAALQRLYAAAGRDIWLDAVASFRWASFRHAAAERLPAGWSALIYHWLGEQLVIFHADVRRVRVWIREPGPVERAALAMGTSPDPGRRARMLGGAVHGGGGPFGAGRRYRRRIGELLVPREVAEDLSPERLLVVVGHGRLHQLPFPALENAGGFLAEQAIVSQAPSLGVLRQLLERSGAEAELGTGPALLLGVERFGDDRVPLPWAREEVDRLASLYGQGARVLREEEATAAALRRLSREGGLRDYGILHLATHAHLDAASGALSTMALADEDLTLVEIGRLRLGPAVVVLSACQSGLGEINPGDEMVTPSSAFLQAGARTVIASLWHVEDRRTVELMTSLHRRLRAGAGPAAALAQAQRGAIERGRAPYEWAAFVATGAP